MVRLNRNLEPLLAAALAAVVLLPTALVLFAGMSALTRVRDLFEAQIIQTSRSLADTTVSAVLTEAELEIRSANREIRLLAEKPTSEARIALAGKAPLVSGFVALDARWRPVYPVARRQTFEPAPDISMQFGSRLITTAGLFGQ